MVKNMLKRNFYNRVARDIKLKKPDFTVNKNIDHNGETLRLTIYKQLEPRKTNSLNTITVTCNRNVVTIIEYNSGLHEESKKLISTIDYSYNQINMVVLTADAVIENIK